MKKRFLSTLMALVLALSLVPTAALAAEDEGEDLEDPNSIETSSSQPENEEGNDIQLLSDMSVSTAEDLESAVSTAQDGDTITLGGNITVSGTLTIRASITLDLNGYELTVGRLDANNNAAVTIQDGSSAGTGKVTSSGGMTCVVWTGSSLTLESGEIENTAASDGIAVFNIGTFTMNGGEASGETVIYNTAQNSGIVNGDIVCNINGGKVNVGIWGVIALGAGVGDDGSVDNDKVTVNIRGGEIAGDGDCQAIATNASGGAYAGFTINISDGTVDGGENGCGMYLPGIGVTNISGGTVSGGQAIRIAAGELHITGGTIEGTAAMSENTDQISGGSGGTEGAIVVGKAGSSGYVGDIVVEVSQNAEIINNETNGAAVVVSDKNMANTYYDDFDISVSIEDVSVTGNVVKVSNLEDNSTQDGGNTTLTIQDATVTGNVTNQSQTGLIIRDTTIDGNVSNTSNGSTAVLGNSTIIGSAIDDANGGTLYYENDESTGTYYAINERTSKVYTDLNTAISEADDGDTITLLDDVVLDGSGVNNNTGAINFTNKNLTIDGSSARYSITAGSNFGMESAWGTTAAGTSHVINITGSSNVTLKNLTINGDWAGTGTTEDFGSGSVPVGANAARHGINIWNNGETTATVRLENVNVTNCSLYAVVARGADLTIDGLTTTGNRWGVNVEDNSTVTIENADIGETDSIVYEAETEGKLTVEDGSYGTIKTQSNATGQIEIAGGSVDSVENATSATVDITGGTIGNVSNTGTGRIDVDGGRVTGTVLIKPSGYDSLFQYKVDGVTVYARLLSVDPDKGMVDAWRGENPTKPGFTFAGWACNQSGVTLQRVDGRNKWVGVRPGETYIFTAQWTENQSSSSDSGSDSEPSYSPVLDVSDGGTVRVSPRTPSEDDEVTITVDPDSGYEVGEVIVTDRNGREIDVTAGRNNTYTFTQPRGRVTIEVTFVREGSGAFFTDVPDTYWAYNEIRWAYDNGYVNGTSASTFSPGASISRQQVWMILARLSGQSPADMAEAQAWAVTNGISDGTTPGAAVTRQQLVALLYRYAQMMGYANEARVDLSSFPDAGSVASYAVEPMQWSVANSIVGGTTDGTLNPTGTATRAQFAVILYRFWSQIG